MNSKMTINSQLSTIEPKSKQTKKTLSKQLEREQNHREGYQQEGGGEEWGKRYRE